MKRALFVLLLLLFACERTHTGRREWIRMSPEEKTLYVRALLGHEKAKEAKGGNARDFPRTVEAYVRSIDRAYAFGDTRDVDEVFGSLAATPDVTPESPPPRPVSP